MLGATFLEGKLLGFQTWRNALAGIIIEQDSKLVSEIRSPI
jgi:hypothetical protein